MLRLLADENFNNDILRGLLRKVSSVDIARLQDTPLFSAPDERVLEWAAQEHRILLTHDRRTIPFFCTNGWSVVRNSQGFSSFPATFL